MTSKEEDSISLNGVEPVFTRGDLAKILNVSTLTVANREKSGKYPPPRRDLNNFRIYNLSEIFNLQIITYGAVDPSSIISVLWDKGYRNKKDLARVIDNALSKKKMSS
jgi:hypothetical protein